MHSILTIKRKQIKKNKANCFGNKNQKCILFSKRIKMANHEKTAYAHARVLFSDKLSFMSCH